ncbi:hypothetical protein ACFLRN_09530 [Thermoproteota archaeon]
MSKSHGDTSDSQPIRKRVFDLWIKDCHITAKKACNSLKLNYGEHGKYLNNLLSEFRSNPSIGLALKAHSLHKRVFVWENVPRNLLFDYLGTEEFHSGLDWNATSNRNGMLVFKGELGSVHWYKGGLVRLYMKGAVMLAQVKELFCKAFWWFSVEELNKYLDVPLREVERHWVFDIGAPVTPFTINNFMQSHGLQIFVDKSHPNAVEVEETVPFWVYRLQEAINSLTRKIEAGRKDSSRLEKE